MSPRESAWVDHAGLRLRYVQHGAGVTRAVLIHELGGSLDSWDGVVAALGIRRGSPSSRRRRRT